MKAYFNGKVIMSEGADHGSSLFFLYVKSDMTLFRYNVKTIITSVSRIIFTFTNCGTSL